MTSASGGSPGPSAQEKGHAAALQKAILKFALIESISIIALAGFLLAFYVYSYLPGQPTSHLIVTLLCFATWVFFAAKVSGLLEMLTERKRGNARR